MTTLGYGPDMDVSHVTISQENANDFINEDVTLTKPLDLAHIAVEKPGATGLTVDLIYPEGATVRLISIEADADPLVTSGIYLGNEEILLPSGSILRTNSTGDVDGTKKVTFVAKRVGV